MGISGLPGSGKSLVSEIATKKGAEVVRGDIIREEAKKKEEKAQRKLQPTLEKSMENIL